MEAKEKVKAMKARGSSRRRSQGGRRRHR